MLEAMVALSEVIQAGAGILGGIFGASAVRQEARANMEAIASEKRWNMGVMEQQKEDVLRQNFLDAYTSGLESGTGTTRAVIENNQNVLQREINFRGEQYDIAYNNQKAKSKQKYLGIF